MRKLAAVSLVILLAGVTSAWGITESSGWVEREPVGLESLQFLDSVHAAGVRGSSVLATSDSGATWAARYVGPPLHDGETLIDACWADGSHLWALGCEDTVVTSENGGLTWSVASVPVRGGGFAGAIEFSDSQHGWIGRGESIARTIDGGGTWLAIGTSAHDGIPRTVTGLDFWDDQYGVASSHGGMLFTSDGGLTWTAGSRVTDDVFYAVDHRTATEVWAVGSNGAVACSDDSGQTWSIVPPLSGAALYDVEWIDEDIGLICGEWGTLLQTVDGGATWHLRGFHGAVSLEHAGSVAWAAALGLAATNTNPGSVSSAPVELALAAGLGRVGTAVRVSQSAFVAGAPEAVVVVGYEAWPDALMAAPLAVAYEGPVLLGSRTWADYESEDGALRAELGRLDPDQVFIVGGLSAADEYLEQAIRESVPDAVVTRVAGADRYETAAAVLDQIESKRQADGLPLSDTVYLATGDVAADALAAGPLAAVSGSPILLTDRDSMPGATSAAFEAYAPAHTVLVGGTERISAELEASIDALSWTETTRVGGGDRCETAVLVAEMATDELGFVWDGVMVCRGDRPWDALSGGPAQASRRAPILLLEEDAIGAQTAEALTAHADEIDLVRVTGGWEVIPYERLDEIELLFD